MGEKITEKENLLSRENVERYAKLYQLSNEQVREVLDKAVLAKAALIGCGVSGESLNLDVLFKEAGGKLVEADSKEVTWDERKRRIEDDDKARLKVDAENRVLAEAKKKLHG